MILPVDLPPFCREPIIQEYLDDYRFLTFSLLELYRASLKTEYLEAVFRITETMLELLFDLHGGFFHPSGVSVLLLRPYIFPDGLSSWKLSYH